MSKLITFLVSVSFSLSVLSFSASAETITTNSWDSLAVQGWNYSANKPVPDGSTDTPDAPNALRFTYPRGDDGSGAGSANYETLNEAEFWYGYWFKFSPNFQWHTIDNKLTYVWNGNARSTDGNWYVSVRGNRTLSMVNQISWGPFQRFNPNTGLDPEIQAGQWYWLEVHARQNTPGKYDGLFELRLDSELVMRHTNVAYRSAAQAGVRFGKFQYAPIWGGNIGLVHEQTDFLWVDFTVISTSPIGMPPARSDTTPPRAPQGVRVQ